MPHADYFLIAALAVTTIALRLNPRNFNDALLPCYDYIVVGGGVSGLVVANRLTEDPNVTVLVLESGPLDQSENYILFPSEDGNGLGSIYDWNLWTTPQTALVPNNTYGDGEGKSSRAGPVLPYDIGRGIGGGSLINGMCWTRGGAADYDAWRALGNPGWGWDDLLPYFIKSENYSDNVEAAFARELYIEPDMSTGVNAVHGREGYVQVSYPKFFFEQSRLFLQGLRELGVPVLTEPGNGSAAGGMLIPNSLDPKSETRSDARTAYFDGFVSARPNFHVASGQLVIKLNVDTPTTRQRDDGTGLWVSGVQFISDGSLVIRNISCAREVILAAGAVHSPQLLELSGIGSPDVLGEFGIPVKIELPGVGHNFQDHPYVGVVYFVSNTSYMTTNTIENNAALLNQTAQEYYLNRTGPWTAGAINTVAFPSLPSISANWSSMMVDAATQNLTDYVIPNLDPTILAGYEVQKLMLIELLSNSSVGAYELLNDNIGLLAVSVMHPFSRGSVHIQSTNPLQQPAIDPRFLSNPVDGRVLVEGLLFNNKLIETQSMSLLQMQPYAPFLPNATAETLMPAIKSGVRTEFHGTGSTSMLPLKLGGVVDSRLKVYGTRNLRIVDAGIFPMVPAAHLQAPVYAVAEKAADIIKGDAAGTTIPSCAGSKLASNFSGIASGRILNSSDSMNINRTRPAFGKSFPQFVNASLLNWTATSNTNGSVTAARNGTTVFTLVQQPDPRASDIAAAANVFLGPMDTTTTFSGELPSPTLITNEKAREEGAASAPVSSPDPPALLLVIHIDP